LIARHTVPRCVSDRGLQRVNSTESSVASSFMHPPPQFPSCCFAICNRVYGSVDSFAWARRRSDRASLLRSQRRQGRRGRGCFVPLQPIGSRENHHVPRPRHGPRGVQATSSSAPMWLRMRGGTASNVQLSAPGQKPRRDRDRLASRLARARMYIHIQVVKWNSCELLYVQNLEFRPPSVVTFARNKSSNKNQA
jgi:hypothetical protein